MKHRVTTRATRAIIDERVAFTLQNGKPSKRGRDKSPTSSCLKTSPRREVSCPVCLENAAVHYWIRRILASLPFHRPPNLDPRITRKIEEIREILQNPATKVDGDYSTNKNEWKRKSQVFSFEASLRRKSSLK